MQSRSKNPYGSCESYNGIYCCGWKNHGKYVKISVGFSRIAHFIIVYSDGLFFSSIYPVEILLILKTVTLQYHDLFNQDTSQIRKITDLLLIKKRSIPHIHITLLLFYYIIRKG